MSVVRAWRAGFTLVELLVVVAIIAVLMAILFPVLNSAREKARQTKCMANLHEIAVAIRMYRLDEGAYPGPYDPVSGQGGVNALYPTYIPSRSIFVCPDDPITSGDKYMKMTGPKPAEDADGACKDHTHRKVYGDLIAFAQEMYIWDPEHANGTTVDPRVFNELYSSYNLLYNYLGYAWFDEANDPNVHRLCTNPDGTTSRLPYKLFRVLPEVNYYQPVFIGDNIAAIYAWYRWDPDNKLNLPSDPNEFVAVDEEMRYTLAMQGYWYDFNYQEPTNQNMESRLRYSDDLGRYLWDPDRATSPGQYGYSYVGLPSAVFPGLVNRNAPENTIITRCPYHRPWTTTVVRRPRAQNQTGHGPHSRGGTPVERITVPDKTRTAKDIVIRLDGSAALVPGLGYDWAVQSSVTH